MVARAQERDSSTLYKVCEYSRIKTTNMTTQNQIRQIKHNSITSPQIFTNKDPEAICCGLWRRQKSSIQIFSLTDTV